MRAPTVFDTSCDGARYIADRTRGFPVIRKLYSRHFREITTGAEFRASLRAGPYAWPGGYALAFITSDGGALCFECARAELRSVTGSIRAHSRDGWRVVGIAGEHESDDGCTCDHCSADIWTGPDDTGAESDDTEH